MKSTTSGLARRCGDRFLHGELLQVTRDGLGAQTQTCARLCYQSALQHESTAQSRIVDTERDRSLQADRAIPLRDARTLRDARSAWACIGQSLWSQRKLQAQAKGQSSMQHLTTRHFCSGGFARAAARHLHAPALEQTAADGVVDQTLERAMRDQFPLSPAAKVTEATGPPAPHLSYCFARLRSYFENLTAPQSSHKAAKCQ